MKKRIVLISGVAILGVAALVPLVNLARTTAAENKRLEAVADLATLIVEAERANAAHDIAFERRLLERAPELSGTPKESAEVERRLAVLDWKYDANHDPARARVRAATDGAEPTEAWLALARLEQSAGAFDAAATAARQALESATTAEETRRAQLAFARAIVEKSVERRLAGEPVDETLGEAFQHLDALVRAEPGLIEVSRRMLQAALLLDRSDAALVAWRSYYHVARGGPAPNAVADAGERLEQLLADSGADRSPERRAALVQALSDSRFFTEAALVASDLEDPRVRKIVAYARLVRGWREITDEYYRLTSLDRGSKSDYRAQLSREARKFFDDAGMKDALDRDEPLQSLQEVASREFGAEIRFGNTAGFYNLHMGHIVVDQRRKVEQYGQVADVRFIMLDNIVSNGFQSWAWESGAQHGGWGGSTQIVQIRPVYVEEPLMIWRKLNDEDQRREFVEEMERETASDEARAVTDPHAYLPGLTLRLSYQGTLQLVERLRSGGLTGDELRMAFVAELERVVQESSIFAHEGRHAIDAAGAAPRIRTWEKEYNAKLSEIAFAPEPRLAMGGIFNSNIGSGTPHGRANAEIMKGVVSWMKRNRSQITRLDADRPLLPQFDLLTDDQMRELFRSMDSLAG